MSYASEVAADSPVAYWRLEESSGNAADSSGNGHTATASGSPSGYSATPPLAGVGGTGIDFDGIDDMFVCGDSAVRGISGAWTLEAIVKPADTSMGGTAIITAPHDSSSRIGYCIGYGVTDGGKKLQVAFYDGGSWHAATDTNDYTPAVGLHVAGTYDGTTLKLYAGGSLIASQAASGNVASSDSSTLLGRRWDTGFFVPYFKGVLDELAIYNTALSATRIGVHAAAAGSADAAPSNIAGSGSVQAPTPNSVATPAQIAGTGSVNAGTYSVGYKAEVLLDSPVAYWRLDESSGNAADSSGNGHTATASGSPSGYSAAPPLAGVGGTGINFDGSDDVFTCADAAVRGISGAWTIEAIIKPADSSMGGTGIICAPYDFNYVGYALGYGLGDNSKKLAVGFYDGSGWKKAADTADYTPGVALHVAGTYDGTTLKLYVGGSLLASQAASGNSASTSGSTLLGRRWDTASGVPYFKGVLDELAIYNTALSATRIGVHAAAAGSADAVPSNIAGSGSVQAPTVTAVDETRPTPSVVSGSGTVQAPTLVVVDSVVASPSVIAGTGSIGSAIRVDIFVPSVISGTGSVLTPTFPPQNDLFADAIEITGLVGSVSYAQYTDATVEGGEAVLADLDDPGGTIWYRWAPHYAGNVTFTFLDRVVGEVFAVRGSQTDWLWVDPSETGIYAGSWIKLFHVVANVTLTVDQDATAIGKTVWRGSESPVDNVVRGSAEGVTLGLDLYDTDLFSMFDDTTIVSYTPTTPNGELLGSVTTDPDGELTWVGYQGSAPRSFDLVTGTDYWVVARQSPLGTVGVDDTSPCLWDPRGDWGYVVEMQSAGVTSDDVKAQPSVASMWPWMMQTSSSTYVDITPARPDPTVADATFVGRSALDDLGPNVLVNSLMELDDGSGHPYGYLGFFIPAGTELQLTDAHPDLDPIEGSRSAVLVGTPALPGGCLEALDVVAVTPGQVWTLTVTAYAAADNDPDYYLYLRIFNSDSSTVYLSDDGEGELISMGTTPTRHAARFTIPAGLTGVRVVPFIFCGTPTPGDARAVIDEVSFRLGSGPAVPSVLSFTARPSEDYYLRLYLKDRSEVPT